MISAARLRRAVRRGTIGVDVAATLDLVGALLKYMSPAFLFPAALALGYREPAWPYLAGGVVTFGVGFLLDRLARGDRERVTPREGFLVVALTWLVTPAFLAIPFLLAGEPQLASPIDAYFEAMSGLTATGATVLTDIEALDRSLAMWRQFTQFLGGMGIIVLAIAVLPRLRVGGRQLLQSELPGPTEIERLTVSIRDTARRLWVLYIALTTALILLLWGYSLIGLDRRMNLYDAVAHSFTAIAIGGFSTKARSLEPFAPITQWTIALFVVVAGINFLRLYRVFVQRQPRAVTRDDEFRLYLVLLLLGSLALYAELVAHGRYGGEEAIRHATIQAISIMTTAGFATADYALWGPLAAVIIVGLMFFGASAGSTGGSIKVVRHVLIGRMLRRELDQTVHPEVISPIRLNRMAVEERVLRAVLAFVLLYVGIFAVGALGLVLESFRTATDVTPYEAIAASAATLGNVGPGWGFAGPMGSYDEFTPLSKVIMSALMWLGRVEIIPIAVLLTRSYWRG